MCFVNNDEVPLLVQDLVTDAALFRVIDTDDEFREVFPRTGSRWNLFLHRLPVATTNDVRVDVEEVIERLSPLLSKVCWCDNEDPVGFVPG